jgi:hypothetical protein
LIPIRLSCFEPILFAIQRKQKTRRRFLLIGVVGEWVAEFLTSFSLKLECSQLMGVGKAEPAKVIIKRLHSQYRPPGTDAEAPSILATAADRSVSQMPPNPVFFWHLNPLPDLPKSFTPYCQRKCHN